MWKGTLTGIHIAPNAGAPLVALLEVLAVPGRGLEGDRYFFEQGSFSRWPGPHRAVSLIAEEDLEQISQQSRIHMSAPDSRRNLLTRGVPLKELLKKEFLIGTVRFRGERLCQPCKYLARKLGEPELIPAMVNRGGIRARILSEGTISVMDPIKLA